MLIVKKGQPMSKNKSSRLVAYLAGRMGNSPKDKEWREEITPFLIKLHFKVANPYILEPRQFKGLRPNRLPKGYKHWYELLDSEDDNLRQRGEDLMTRVIKFDLNYVRNKTDIVIVRWSESCKDGAGTQAEMSIARLYDIPVYCITEYPVLPDWLKGCCTQKFKSMQDLLKFLAEEYGDNEEDISQELIN